MKRKQLWSLLGAALPLVLAAVLVFGWQMPRGTDGGELLCFLAAAVVGYPLVGVLSGIVSVRLGLHRVAAVPVAALGYGLAAAMELSPVVGVTFAFWGAVVTVCGVIFALRMHGE